MPKLQQEQPDRSGAGRDGEVRLLQLGHEDPAEPLPGRRDVRAVVAALAAGPTVKLGSDTAAHTDDLQKGKALRRLEARYGEARELLSSEEQPHRNLDWVLGASGTPKQRGSNLSLKMIPLVSLWLEDLAVELERGLAPGPLGDPDERVERASEACKAAARSLREATEGFLSSVNPVRRKTMSAPQVFAILFTRLPRVENAPGLILLRVDSSRGSEPPTMVGTLTDAALRGRLAHFDLHTANELAAVRKALANDSGEATVYEHWSGLESCLQFWYGFSGSQIRLMAWTCEGCGETRRESIGGSVGETFPRLCPCGQATHLTVPKTIGA